jgi:tRNA threonylcarbamoyladenosine biosynthesis protein TsaE
MPILDANTFEFISRSADQTRRIGIRLGEIMEPGDVVCLTGELGAGKTTFVQGVVRGWGSSDQVTSPTFVLVNNYRLPDGQVLSHLDAYRLENASEAENLDLESMLTGGPLLVEWADRIMQALPEERLEIQMAWLAEELRQMVITFKGKRYQRLLNHLKEGMVKSFE